MRFPTLLLLFLTLPSVAQTPAGPAPDGLTARSFEEDVIVTVAGEYLVGLPDGYADGTEAWPLLLFLHGAGERGDSLAAVAVHGPPKLIAAGEALPFIVVAPQVPAWQWWDVGRMTAVLDDVMQTYRVDPDRVYVTGLSMGGFGTWALAAAMPDRIAAIAPVCGGGDPATACGFADVPTWAFHGAQDQIVPLSASEEMVDALRACGADAVTFTVYPEANHDSWTETYANPELYDWLLSHRLSDRE